MRERRGTITLNDQSLTVVGSGTHFNSARPGFLISSRGVVAEIQSIISDTRLETFEPLYFAPPPGEDGMSLATISSQPYFIIPIFDVVPIQYRLDTFQSSGQWTKPPGTFLTRITGVAPGSSGNGGGSNNRGGALGGNGGSGGQFGVVEYSGEDLPNILNVMIGSVGSPGVGSNSNPVGGFASPSSDTVVFGQINSHSIKFLELLAGKVNLGNPRQNFQNPRGIFYSGVGGVSSNNNLPPTYSTGAPGGGRGGSFSGRPLSISITGKPGGWWNGRAELAGPPGGDQNSPDGTDGQNTPGHIVPIFHPGSAGGGGAASTIGGKGGSGYFGAGGGGGGAGRVSGGDGGLGGISIVWIESWFRE